MAAIWHQLALTQDITPAQILRRAHQERGTSITIHDIHKLLDNFSQELSNIFVLVNALDEYSDMTDAPVI